jgi:hypothetical protein
MSAIGETWRTDGIEAVAEMATDDGPAWQFRREDNTFFTGRVRGGICWPWPKRVGVRTVTQGAAVAVCHGLDGTAHAVGWGLCRAIGPSFDEDGLARQLGLSGLVRFGASRCDCVRWRTWARDDAANFGATRALRSHLGAVGRTIMLAAWNGDVTPEGADRIITTLAEEGRLDIPDALASVIESEDSSQTGCRPATEALAAALTYSRMSP